MKTPIAFAFLIVAGPALAITPAYRIRSVKVSGEKLAEIYFQTDSAPDALPKLTVEGSTIEVTFPAAEIESSKGKLVIEAPHALVSRLEAANENGSVKARVTVNGKAEGLKSRVGIAREEGGVRLRIQYPQANDSALELAKEEQLPLGAAFKTAKPETARLGMGSVFLLVAIFLGLGVAVFYTLKFLKDRTGRGGSRKYLIEQLGYTCVGPGGKTGVGLLKIGREFVLIGVTPQQISLLSALPKLAEDYQEDSKLERSAFKEAVEEEYRRLKISPSGETGLGREVSV